MVDGKIENLWLKDEGTTNRLDNIRMLATLLGYVRNFCTVIEVPHISSIQKCDHPVWLRDFFTIAGFNRCDCLKPEAGSQRYRACVKLGSPGQAAVREPLVFKSTGGHMNGNDCTTVEGKENEEIHSQCAVAGLTVAKISPAKQKPGLQLPKVTEAIMARQRPDVNLPKAAESGSLGNGQVDKGSLKTVDISPAKNFSAHQALAWLSENKEILSPITTLSASSPSQAQATTSFKEAQHIENGVSDKGDVLTGEKRRREVDNAGLKDAKDLERSTKQRRIPKNEDELHIEQDVQDEKLTLKPSTHPKQTSLPAARYSYTMADKSSKSKSLNEGRLASSSMTDALLAQVAKAATTTSPKHIKKEPTASRPLSSPPPEIRHHRSQDMPPKMLTCFYWKHQGGCNKRDEDCLYAHYDTGHDASAPNAWKYSVGKRRYASYTGQYDEAADYYDNPNSINFKGSHDGTNGSTAAPTGPRADAEGLSYNGSRWEPYDSYRPHSHKG